MSLVERRISLGLMELEPQLTQWALTSQMGSVKKWMERVLVRSKGECLTWL